MPIRIRGKEIAGPMVETIVIPRQDGEDIVFKAQAVLDMGEFDKICPAPKPPIMIKRGVGKVEDTEDKGYKKALEQHGKLRIAYMVIQSLKATEELEWDKVKENDPGSWLLYEEDLKDSGFSQIERQRIVNGVFTANALSEEKIQEARKRFFDGEQEASQEKTSQTEEQKNTPSGELVNASESNHQAS